METYEYKWVKGKELLDLPRGVFKLGEAPDGLPYALVLPEPDRLPLISNARSLLELVTNFLGRDANNTLALSKIISQIQSDTLTLSIPEYGDYFILPGSIKGILGQTLLDRMVSSQINNGLVKRPQEGRKKDKSETEENTALLAAQFEEKGEAFEIPTINKRLLVPIGDSPVLIGIFETVKARNLSRYRELIFETVEPIPYEVGIHEDGSWEAIDRDDAYEEQRYDSESVKLRIGMKEILGVVVKIVEGLVKHHSTGKIHGDLKPSNILLTKAGAVLIDSLEIKPGDISSALTIDYAAPEQILSLPVSAAIDVFAIGRLLQKLLSALAFGEVRTFEIPLSSSGLKRVELLVCRGVFIDPGQGCLSFKEIPLWQKLIKSCLEFDPVKRIELAELQEEIEKLVLNSKTACSIYIPLQFGRLSQSVDKSSKEPVWLVGDNLIDTW